MKSNSTVEAVVFQIQRRIDPKREVTEQPFAFLASHNEIR